MIKQSAVTTWQLVFVQAAHAHSAKFVSKMNFLNIYNTTRVVFFH